MINKMSKCQNSVPFCSKIILNMDFSREILRGEEVILFPQNGNYK